MYISIFHIDIFTIFINSKSECHCENVELDDISLTTDMCTEYSWKFFEGTLSCMINMLYMCICDEL
jgi:hypothetical protein